MDARLKRMFAVALLGAVSAAVAFAVDITGQWTTVIDTMMGQAKWSYTFKLDGSKLTGTATDKNGAEVKLEEGKVEGDAISFVENREIEVLRPTKFTYR